MAALEDAGVPVHLTALVAEALSFTWSSTQGCPQVALCGRGGRPGDPLADAVFGFVFG